MNQGNGQMKPLISFCKMRPEFNKKKQREFPKVKTMMEKENGQSQKLGRKIKDHLIPHGSGIFSGKPECSKPQHEF